MPMTFFYENARVLPEFIESSRWRTTITDEKWHIFRAMDKTELAMKRKDLQSDEKAR
jgi:hypothetical protein